MGLPADVRALLVLHAALLAGFGLSAALEAPERGWLILGVVVAYNVALPLVARGVGRRDWLALWAFLLPLSAFQVLPDWILVRLVGTLRFGEIGGPRLDDAITLAMAGMWVAPLFVVVVLARGRVALAAGVAVVVFLGSELLAPVLEIWEPVGDTTQVAGVALYVLPAEAVLGAATAGAWAALAGAPAAARAAAAAAVATLYTGALVVSHFLIDVAGWSVTA